MTAHENKTGCLYNFIIVFVDTDIVRIFSVNFSEPDKTPTITTVKGGALAMTHWVKRMENNFTFDKIQK